MYDLFMRFNFSFLMVFLVFVSAFSKEIHFSSCYKGYYFFIPVIKNCISYDEIDGRGRFTTHVNTIGFLKLFKDIKYVGLSISKKDISKKFFFSQKEKDFSVEYWYEFLEGKILTKKTVKKNGKIKRITKVVDNKENYLDPFTASVVMFKSLKNKNQGFLKIFFNGKKYKIPYRISSQERLRLNGKYYSCYVIEIKPKIKGEGLIKTKGKWIVWAEKTTGFPVKVKAVFDKGIIYLNKE